MIFNKDLLYIHVPKTGGTSVGNFLLQVLPRPVYHFIPLPDHKLQPEDVIHVNGTRHESVAQAIVKVRDYGFEVSNFPLILAALRNPYDLVVSRWAFLRHIYKDRPITTRLQELALSLDFESFAIEHNHPPQERLFLVDGALPQNLKLISFENLANDLFEALRATNLEEPCTEANFVEQDYLAANPDVANAVSEGKMKSGREHFRLFGKKERRRLRSRGGGTTVKFPTLNTSPHDHYSSYITPAAEEAIYLKNKWVFDHGYYGRFDGRKPD